MVKKSHAIPTVKELVSTLRHSSLSSVVVEGKDDIIVYRFVEEACHDLNISVICAGGRSPALEIFLALNSDDVSNNTLFIVDRDTWVYESVPSEYTSAKILLTDGYSIENDMYHDGDLETLLSGMSSRAFQCELETTLNWYALAIKRLMLDRSSRIDVHPAELLDAPGRFELLNKLCPSEVYPDNIRSNLTTCYGRLLRGKTLLSLLLRHCAVTTQVALLQFGASRRGIHLQRLFKDVREHFELRRVT